MSEEEKPVAVAATGGGRAARPSLELVVNDGQRLDDLDKRGGPGGAPPTGGDIGDPASVVPVPASDDALAVELSRALGADWRCGMPGSEWYEWDTQRWVGERTQRVFDISRQVCRRYAAEYDLADKLGREVSSTGKAYAAVKFAAADRSHATPLGDFDRDPWRINTPSGIIDLRSGQRQDHERDALMSKIAAAGPEGECPTWRRFLREATGDDDELAGFLQRWAGYCLTGLTDEQVFVFLHGKPGTGKSTYQKTLRKLVGDYGLTAEMETFIVAKGERHPTELAQFVGRRLIVANETDEGRFWNESRLCGIVDGTPINAHFMRQDNFEFVPQAKLLFAGNHRPRLRSGRGGLRRRLLLVTLNHKPKRVDPHLEEKLDAELGGILKWAIEGEVLRQRLGLRPPQAVLAATRAYFRAEDTIGRWIDERCVRGPNERALPAQLYRDFLSWAATVGEFWRPSLKMFSEALDEVAGIERGYVDLGRDATGKRQQSPQGYRGLSLRYGDAELPLDTPRRARGTGRVEGDFLPGGDDPAEDWPRE